MQYGVQSPETEFETLSVSLNVEHICGVQACQPCQLMELVRSKAVEQKTDSGTESGRVGEWHHRCLACLYSLA